MAIDNHRITAAPAVVVQVHSPGDVIASMKAARTCNTTFSVRGGGHGAAGFALTENGIVLSMALLNSIRLGDSPQSSSGRRSIVVQAGANYSDIYNWAIQNLPNYNVVGGGCPAVGIAGFLQGGGWSFLSRGLGLAIDSLLGARIVLANSSVVWTNATLHPDLFWALRGGGGGNWGVVMELEIEVFPKPRANALVGQICFPPFENVEKLFFDIWLPLNAKVGNLVNLDPSWLPTGPNGTILFCITTICEDTASACDAAVAPFLAENPVLSTLKEQSFMQWSANHLHLTDAQSGRIYLTSAIALESDIATGPLFMQLAALLKRAPSSRNLVLFHNGGGKIGSVDKNATAFAFRDVFLTIQVKAIWTDVSDDASNIAWVEEARILLQNATQGSYIDYMDPALSAKAYYGDNLSRLCSVKCKYDPENFFHFAQGISSVCPECIEK